MTHALKALPELLSAALLLALWIEPQRFGSGVWEAEPHRALAGGVVYFTLMGLARPFLAAYAVRPAAEAGPVHPMTDRQMWISVGVLVLVITVLLVIMGNQEWVLARLAGN